MFASINLKTNKIIIMNKAFTYLSMASVLFLASCGNTEEVTIEETAPVVETYTVDTENSGLTFLGSKTYAGYGHNGTVSFSEGTVTTTDSVVTSANFTVDLNTMNVTDSMPEEKLGYLIGHLKSADFFAVDSLGNTATFEVTSVENGMMKGSMTVMGLSKDVEVATTIEMTEGTVTVSGDFEIDLAQFGLAALQAPVMEEGVEMDEEAKQNIYDQAVKFSVNITATK